MLTHHTRHSRHRRAFSLIELAVVLVVIGISSSIAVPTYQTTITESRWNAQVTRDEAVARRIAIGLLVESEKTYDQVIADTLAEEPAVGWAAPVYVDVDGNAGTVNPVSFPSWIHNQTSTSPTELAWTYDNDRIRTATKFDDERAVLCVVTLSNLQSECAAGRGSDVPSGDDGSVDVDVRSPDYVYASGQPGVAGWSSISYNGKLFSLTHHTNTNTSVLQPELSCIDADTGEVCTGTYPKNLTVGGKQVVLGQSPQPVLVGTKMYIPVVVSTWVNTFDINQRNDYGLYCYDLATEADCPTQYVKMGAGVTLADYSDANAFAKAPLGGIQQFGTKLYVVVTYNEYWGSQPYNGWTVVSCYDTATSALCPGYTLGSINPGWGGLSGKRAGADTYWNSFLTHYQPSLITSMDSTGKLYFIVDFGTSSYYHGNGDRVRCFDTVTGAQCAGSWDTNIAFGTAQPVNYSAPIPFSTALISNPLAASGGVCIVTLTIGGAAWNLSDPSTSPTMPERYMSCLAANGTRDGWRANIADTNPSLAGVNNAAAWPDGLAAALTNSSATGNPLWQNANAGNALPAVPRWISYEPVKVGTKTYFPVTTKQNAPDYGAVGLLSGAYCYDWATDAACTGFGTAGISQFTQPAGGRLQLYSFDVAEDGCIWGSGLAGWTFAFDPATGATGCGDTYTGTAVEPLADPCPDSGLRTVDWHTATVENVDTSKLDSLTLDVTDMSGIPLNSYDLMSGSADISDLPSLDIKAYVHATGDDPSDWGGTPAPTVKLTYTSQCPL